MENGFKDKNRDIDDFFVKQSEKFYVNEIYRRDINDPFWVQPKSIWSWGRNNFGQLGLNNTTNRSSPVQIGLGTDWSLVSCGYEHTVALKI